MILVFWMLSFKLAFSLSSLTFINGYTHTHKEGWAPNSWCFPALVSKKTLESPVNCKENIPINPKGNQPWIFIGRTDSKAEAPIFWPAYAKSQFIRKDPAARKDWRQKAKWVTKEEMVGWHHWFTGHKFEHTLGGGEGHEGLVCCSPWAHKESDTTEWTTKYIAIQYLFICLSSLWNKRSKQQNNKTN